MAHAKKLNFDFVYRTFYLPEIIIIYTSSEEEEDVDAHKKKS